MKQELSKFDRMDIFNYFNEKSNPFINITTKIDITNIYNNCKNYYATIGYFIACAINKVDNFKYRYEGGKFYLYDKINPNFAEPKNGNVGFFTCELKDNYHDFIDEYKKVKEKFASEEVIDTVDRQDEIWLSCTPWFGMTATIPPYDKSVTIPQFIWDKFDIKDNRCYINLMIMAHHGFVDGYHISLFLKELNNMIENINDYI